MAVTCPTRFDGFRTVVVRSLTYSSCYLQRWIRRIGEIPATSIVVWSEVSSDAPDHQRLQNGVLTITASRLDILAANESRLTRLSLAWRAVPHNTSCIPVIGLKKRKRPVKEITQWRQIIGNAEPVDSQIRHLRTEIITTRPP